MPIPSQTKVMPTRQTVRSDFSVVSAPKVRGIDFELAVLAHLHGYPPLSMAGGPLTVHGLLSHGARRGWKPRVVVDARTGDQPTVYDDVPVRYEFNVRGLSTDYVQARVVVTQLDTTPKAVELSRRHGKPLVHLVHNDRQLAQHLVQRRDCALAIFNSRWLQARVGWEGPAVVSHPHTPIEQYQVDESGDAVTLINLTEVKGAPLFYELASRNPGVRFIGVKGSYGVQIAPPDLPNLEIWESQADIRNVYRQTRVLVMPSARETWGRTAVEAGCSGIPTICSSTLGLRETGMAESYLMPDDAEGWNKAVRRLIRGPRAWEEASEAALARAAELEIQSLNELDEACDRIENLV